MAARLATLRAGNAQLEVLECVRELDGYGGCIIGTLAADWPKVAA